ncbi:hypothetical protein [Streptomyces sp. NBC_00893]|uniref:hypothetical protein n=1 Tax=Streptomyces sp. NBC_00893 TaxID=2975862 RepID=UPI00224DDEFE|nr:hypothetical protein [Streptomyces sp. NBC_00893]MCX4846102.1 hypothetical protein [Streptomyces sp. NBC_00893]
MMRQHIKLSAVLVVVVLALTGFSTSSHGGRSGKSKSHGSSSGGGCSNSKKSNNGYHSSDYDDDDYDSSSSSSGGTDYSTPTATASDEPEVYVSRCAQPRKGKRKAVTASTVRLTADADATGSHTYEVDVTFLDAVGNTVDTGDATVKAEGGETKTVSVRMDNPRKVSKVNTCRVDAELSY